MKDCCLSKERGFKCQCYSHGPTFRDIDEEDNQGCAKYHEQKDREAEEHGS